MSGKSEQLTPLRRIGSAESEPFAAQPDPAATEDGIRLCECGCGQPAAIAKTTDRSRGYVKGQPTRFARGHLPGRRVARQATKPNHKVCVACDVEKSNGEFPRDTKPPDQLHSYCKTCKGEFMRAANGRWKERHPDRQRRSTKRTDLRKLALRHGVEINIDLYDRMVDKQDGRCLICGARPGRIALAADHDHETGRVRGLLCRSCNQGLGHFRDDPRLLKSAANYLERGPQQAA